MKRFLSGFIVLFLFWAAFAGSFSIAEVFVGAAAAAVISLLTVRIFDFNILTPDLPVRLIRFVFVYLPRLVWEMTKANITMAKIVLDPSLPIDPGIVVAPSRLNGDLARLVLANSITLTPGTLALDVESDGVTVHCVNMKKTKMPVTAVFEDVIKGVFE